MPEQLVDFLTALRIPDTRRAISTRGHDLIAGRLPLDRKDRAGVTQLLADFFASMGIPDPCRAVAAGCDDI